MTQKKQTVPVAMAAADVWRGLSGDFASLSRRPVDRATRQAMGRELRQVVPRTSLREWNPGPDRPDPVALIQASHEGRVDSLVPIRVGRMAASPYGFLRGSAVVMAWDVASLPSTGIMPVVCGDAHLGNFGFYASPERDLVMDLNDFDEAHTGAWEWDLRRLVASVWVAGRHNGFREDQCHDSVVATVAAYRHELRALAQRPLLDRAYTKVDVDRLKLDIDNESLRKVIRKAVRQAQARTSDRVLPKLTTEHDGVRQIVPNPPIVQRVSPATYGAVRAGMDDYLRTLSPQWARVLGGYTIVDIAHKVVGVGSVGLRAFVVLLEGSSPDDVVFLQLKQARRSVLAPFVHGEVAWHAHQGQRVVEYQQALQTVSDPLLGWTTIDGLQYYVRQFRNMKGTVPLDSLDPSTLPAYVSVVGRLLAKGHARTSGASMIAAYLGASDKVDLMLAGFARAYADQTEADHAALAAAVKAGRIEAIEPVGGTGFRNG